MNMTDFDRNMNDDLLLTLRGLIRNWENEVVEFKQVSSNYDRDKIGRYFSAISNEANLKGLQYGWLIFGVQNDTRDIVGTEYRDTCGLETLKQEIAQSTTDGISFIGVFEVYDGDKRVIMFKIPAAVSAIPTGWKGHWYGRNGESLGPLSHEELERLRGQVRRDWSKQMIEGSSVSDLDVEAIRVARENYKNKLGREHISAEIDSMTDEAFLTKIGLIVKGRLTNAAMVLLGNPEYAGILDVPVRMMWRLQGSDGMIKDYKEFTMPFILAVDKVYAKVRNLVYRYLPNQQTLFPTETQQYDASLLRELLNNCIAHQDYTLGGRIYLDEFEDSVIISNPGNFLPGNIREVLKPGYTAPYYRNQLLADAMVKFNMIDTVQMGIRKVFNIQRNRYFPMPDYDLSTPQKIAVTIYGKVLDENYTQLLFGRHDLALDTVFLLDRVQKKLPLDKEQYKALKQLGVIEGRIPNVYISAAVAEVIDARAQYIKDRGMSDQYYMDMIVNYLERFEKGTRADFAGLLSVKLPDVLSEEQKANKVRNLLSLMKQQGQIDRVGNNRSGVWVLTKH